MRRFASGFLLAGASAIVLAAGLSAAPRAGGRPRAAPPSGALLEQLAQPPVRTSLASQRIYFVMPDRYANGDTTNDRGWLAGPREATGYDPSDPAWFHGGDLAGLTGDCADKRRGLARLKDLGFTAVWLTPPFRQKYVQGDSAGYHGYWISGFDSIDPHLGTESEFGAFVDCAHRLGLKVIVDVVVNHTADVIRLSGGSSFAPPSSAPYRDCRGRTFNPAKYVRKTFPCLSAARMPRRATIPAAEASAKSPAWLNDVTKYHDRGDINFTSCSDTCSEQGDFFGLDDLFTEQPAVVDGLADVYGEWIRRYRIDGFRVDTARHVNAAFFQLWVPKVLAAARSAGIDDFQIFGEVVNTDDAELSAYVRNRGLPNVLDFPFQDAAAGLAAGTAIGRAVADRLTNDDYFRSSPDIAPTPPTFLGNHDMGRAAYEIRRRNPGAGRLLERVLLGYDLLYLMRGAPVVYYGDEVGIVGDGGDQRARQDLFATRVAEWKTEERLGSPAIGDGSSFDVDSPIGAHLRLLGALRDSHPALATGATVVRRAQGRLLVVSRFDAAARREYVAAFNAGTSAARVSVGTATPSSGWTPLLGGAQQARSGSDGTLAFDVPALAAVLVRADADLPAASPSAPALRIVRDGVTPAWRLTATVGGRTPVSVAFVVRRARGSWSRLAADDSPPYRAFLDPGRYRRKERVQLLAIARTLDGRVRLSRVLTFTVRR